ncbi:hypothetical protein A2867_03585 [Candidatus Daviesbacteria bacterium RIFCSPHIGHO2_01_FULL_40_11]|uniref:Membrane protein 6-pyruvoyl-tetrahydropterin synthase-related domain-containing protein n=1 Tax=Candidatus Daviesbacteria bacterium RIFCSPHIGHO2_01_FULL_40_11 TaxID=1797762 RepID=A0A1F5JK47_9BACT|nr:MAG: hypothetical protein A2867_03585 [Candidatus Daviesbacteria bacterium RIFCSPHIGHO2_01_FULL_40_11]OGE62780.1 MAG: hypothetical protein A2964_01690 [Candidatus Daviesbacteria bacterium RIFCSPLOWO2_01_FULL_40_27]
MIKLVKSLKLQGALVFFLISAFIVVTWFRDSAIYGGAEVGLFGYNPQRWLEISKYVWWEAVSPGQLIPHFITAVPLYFFFTILNLIGLSAQNIQQLFFFLILFLMGFGMYLLSLNILAEDQKKYSLFAGLFYMFNAYTLVSVWHRFLYPTLILAAVLPFLILWWRKWTNEGKIFYLNLFLLVNFLSVYMYGNLASLVTVWIALSLVSIAEVFFPWQGRAFVGKLAVRFLAGFIFFVLTNIWWIAPTFSIAPGLLPEQHSSEDNLGTLIVLGRQTIMPYLLQLANPFYLFYRQELGAVYTSFIFKLIPWMISGVLLVGLIASLKLKDYAKYALIFIAALLLSKGASSPFSYPPIFAFEQFYFLGVLRNPFEKLGIILPIFGAILFAIGLQALLKWGSSRFGSGVSRLVSIMVLFALLGYAWPMLGGNIFGTKQYPAKATVPESYQEANRWLTQQKDDQGVILHLPFSGKDVVTYDWNEGYHGVDQNEILFTSMPSLSRVVGIKRIDDTLNSLTYIFTPPFSEDDKQILRVLQFFNIKFIVLHKDTAWDDKDTYGEKGSLLEPNSLEKVLDGLNFLKKEEQFGQLIIYKLTDENFKAVLRFSRNAQIVYPGESNIIQVLSKTKEEGDIISSTDDKIADEVTKISRQTLIFPDKKFQYFDSSPSAVIAKASDSFKKLLQLRAYFESIGYSQSERLTDELIEATKKVTLLNEDFSQSADYKQLIKRILDKYSKNSGMRLIFDADFSSLMSLHILILRQLGAESIADWIDGEMVKMEVSPKVRNSTQVFKFTIPAKGSYEILTDSQQKDIFINGKSLPSQKEGIFDEADYEIGFKDNIDDVVLRQQSLKEVVSTNRLLGFKQESPVSYSGKVNFASPGFIIFAQGFHPGWQLTLSRSGQQEKIKEHFLSNLYGNAWWVDKTGEYDFKIEFTPQKIADMGVTLALATTILLIIVNLYIFLRRIVRR